MNKKYVFVNVCSWFICLVTLFLPTQVFAQDPKLGVPNGTEGEFFPPKDSTATVKEEKRRSWNEFNLGFTTLRLGMGYLVEYDAFSQDDNGRVQTDSLKTTLEPTFKTRDARLLIGGKLNTKRSITWKAGFMYDGVSDSWFVRETGVMVGVPEISGHIFVGRTKEGYSLNKVMNGYAGWTMERQMALDAIPLLADGIKWLGYFPKQKLIYNVGIFTDWLSKDQSFSTFKWQFAARIAYLPIYSPGSNTVFHIGANFRYGDPEDGKIKLRSKPEANFAPYFIDTKDFTAAHGNAFGPEIYYSKGPLMVGGEYHFHNFMSPKGDHHFNGGDAVISYIFTGESRPYTTVSGIYSFVPVKRSIFKGGPGAWEGVLRLSHMDLDDNEINGGKFWRITPMVNWYMSPNFRLELAYGYGVLNRFNIKGATQFFQTRLQFTIL